MTDRASIETFNCYACTTGFENEAELIAHVKEVGHNYCIDCRKEFNSPESLNEHQTTSKKHLKFVEKRQSRILNLSAETLADIDIVAQSKTNELSKEPAPELQQIDEVVGNVTQAVETGLSKEKSLDAKNVTKASETIAETATQIAVGANENTVQAVENTNEKIEQSVSESKEQVEESVKNHIAEASGEVSGSKDKVAQVVSEKKEELAEVAKVEQVVGAKVADSIKQGEAVPQTLQKQIETVVQISEVEKDVQVLVSEKSENVKAKARLCSCTIL
ncbi:hypothetical protein HDV06_002304 [Boothiomyces sp. JEL0866]|nr:hypothetical protein HDV06_002304 [Boothiomyces sp. JEL0866]